MVNRSIRNFLQFVAPDHAGSTTDNTDYAAQLRLAQLESVDKQTGSMLLAHVAGAVFLGAAVLHPSNAAFLAVWLAGFFLLLLSIPARKWARRGLMRSAGNTVPVRALAFIRLQMHVAGLLWAAGAIMLFPGAASEAKILVVVAVAGAMATGAMAFHAVPSIAGIFASVIALGIVVAVSLDRGGFALPLVLLVAFLFTAIMHAVNEAGRVFAQNLLRQYEQEKSKELFSVLFRDFENSTSDWMWEVDRDGRLSHVSPQFFQDHRFKGYSFDGKPLERLLCDPASVVRGDRVPRLQRQLLNAFQRKAPFKDIIVAVRILGAWRYWRLAGRPVLGPDGSFQGMRGACSDITDSFEAENRLQFLAMHDALTGLPNRENFNRAFGAALATMQSEGGQLALLAIDLDKFKMVNDTLGHQAGDEVLRAVAARLNALLDRDVMFARFGGDEFCAYVCGAGAGQRAEALAQTVTDALRQPVELSSGLAEIGCSIGIAVGPRDGLSAETLHRNADLALYRAKGDPAATWCVFEPAMDASARKQQDLEYELRKAIKRKEFELYFQPLVNSGTGHISCYETLLRWNSAKFGRVPPGDFIRIAEKTGLIHEIGEWVIRRACMEAARWPVEASVAINLSPRQLEGFRLLDIVKAALAESGLAASRLELEVTESALEAEPEHAAGLLHRLRTVGARISLDDFGTGYSSLSYLVRFPIDKLKIDKSFVQDAMYSEQNLAIVRAIVSLARSMKVRTTAEGVETLEQARFLRLEGIDEFQGYLIGRPKPAAQLQAAMAGSSILSKAS